MDKSKYGVHRTHCCIRHGCKYGDENCPVVNKKIKQEYLCEECGDEGIKTIDELFESKKLKYKIYDKVNKECVDLHKYCVNGFGDVMTTKGIVFMNQSDFEVTY